MNRRGFLGATAGTIAARSITAGSQPEQRPNDGRPPVTNPRATSGDSVAEPDWTDRLTITVGQKNADLVGSTHRVLQAAQHSFRGQRHSRCSRANPKGWKLGRVDNYLHKREKKGSFPGSAWERTVVEALPRLARGDEAEPLEHRVPRRSLGTRLSRRRNISS